MFLESLGRPLGRPWEGFWVTNFEAKKLMKKKSGRRLPRRVTRTPDKTLPRDFLSMIRHAFAPPGAGGQADCLRFASPAEALVGPAKVYTNTGRASPNFFLQILTLEIPRLDKVSYEKPAFNNQVLLCIATEKLRLVADSASFMQQ